MQFNHTDNPYNDGLAITPDDANPIAKVNGQMCRGLWIGTGGTVIVRFWGETTPVTLAAMPNGYLFQGRIEYLNVGTTASNIVALY